MRHHVPDAVFILVGTKADLREDKEEQRQLAEKGETFVSWEEGVVKTENKKTTLGRAHQTDENLHLHNKCTNTTILFLLFYCWRRMAKT